MIQNQKPENSKNKTEREKEEEHRVHNLENTVPTLGISGAETYHDVGIHNNGEAEEVFGPAGEESLKERR